MSPSRLSSVPLPLLSENVRRDGTVPKLSVPARFQREESYVSSTTLREFACKECCLLFPSEMDEKFIELCVNVRNYITYQIRSIVIVSGKKNCGDK